MKEKHTIAQILSAKKITIINTKIIIIYKRVQKRNL